MKPFNRSRKRCVLDLEPLDARLAPAALAAPTVTAPVGTTQSNAATVTLTGSAAAGGLVTAYLDTNNNGLVDAGERAYGSQQLAAGQTAYDFTVPLMRNAVNRFLISVTDAAGTQSNMARAPIVVADSTPPAPPAVTAPAAAMTVTVLSATIAGTAEAGSRVTVATAAGEVVGAQQLGRAATAYAVTVPLTVGGPNRFVVTATDVVGNVSPAATVPDIGVSTPPPRTPIVAQPATRTRTTASTVTIAGEAAAGGRVDVYADADANGRADAGEPLVSTEQLAADTRAYSLAVPLASNRVNYFVAVVTDAFGQVSGGTAVPAVVQGTPEPGVATQVVAVGAGTGGAAALLDADGRVRLRVAAFDAPGGVRVATADVTGDGVPDLVAATGPGVSNQVKVFDGATGAALQQLTPFEPSFTGGLFVKAVDLTGDGRAEIVVTPDEGGGPRVEIFDAASGVLLANFFGIDDPNFRGGARVAVGDPTGDGVPDLIVAAGAGGGPRVTIYDGRRLTADDRQVVANFFVFEDTLRNGVYVAAGDLTGDGYSDVVVGGGPGGGPRVFALSGQALTGGGQLVPVADFFAGDPAARGGVRVGTADLDLDGRADLVTASGGQVLTYFGADISATGSPLLAASFDPFADNPADGVYVG